MPLLYALLAAAAAWVALGRINASLTADSAVPVLLGLYAWEPYFWEQNRYGMLVPLVVGPVRDPFAHLLAQTAVGAFLTLLGLHLAGRYLYRAGWSPLAGAAAAAFFLAACGPHGQFVILCPAFAHHGGLALGFGGLLLALPRADGRVAPGRLAAAAAVLTAGAWLNLGIVPQLAPLVVFRRWLVDRGLAAELRSVARQPRGALAGSELARAAAVLGVALAVNVAGQAVAPYPTMRAEVPPVGEWAGRVVAFAEGLGWHTKAAYLVAVGAAVAGALAAGPPARPATLAAVLAGLCYGLVMALTFLGRGRYFLPCLLVIQAAAVGGLVVVFERSAGVRWRPGAWAAVLGAALAGLLAVHGRPSVANARAALDAGPGRRTADLLAAGATHLAGDYWTVWPAVMHANLVLGESGSDRRVWGLTHRSRPTRRYWAAGPEVVRVAVVPGEEDAALGYLEMYGFTDVRLAEVRPGLAVYTARRPDP